MSDIHQQNIQESLADLIGLPYAAYDCWELVKFFYLKLYEVDLYDYSYDDPNNTEKISYLIDLKKQDFKKVTRPFFGDIILFRIDGLPAHLGVYIDESKFLHTTGGTGSCLDNLKIWKHKIVGFYKYDQN